MSAQRKTRYELQQQNAKKKPRRKECSTCKSEFPLSEFPVRHDSADGYRNQCFGCLKGKRLGFSDSNQTERTGKRQAGKDCEKCAGLSWRVSGPKCRCCGLRYEAEPAPEPMLTRYVDPVSGW